MATARKTHFHYVVVTKFYTPKALAEIYGMKERRLLDQAMIAGALYRIGTKKLINRVRIEKFLKNAGDFTYSMDGKYCQMSEAVKQMGIPEDMLMRFASDADALIKIDNEILVNLDKLDEYIENCKHTINVDDEDEDEYRSRNYRRGRDLCLR